MPLAIDMNLVQQISPVREVLDKGNQSMKWLQAYSGGKSVQAVLQSSIAEMEAEEMKASISEIAW